MTPKEKAQELVYKFRAEHCREMIFTADFNLEREKRLLEKGKQCALIAVDEILDEVYRWAGGDNTEWDIERFEYLKKVKQEIEKL